MLSVVHISGNEPAKRERVSKKQRLYNLAIASLAETHAKDEAAAKKKFPELRQEIEDLRKQLNQQ